MQAEAQLDALGCIGSTALHLHRRRERQRKLKGVAIGHLILDNHEPDVWLDFGLVTHSPDLSLLPTVQVASASFVERDP